MPPQLQQVAVDDGDGMASGQQAQLVEERRAGVDGGDGVAGFGERDGMRAQTRPQVHRRPAPARRDADGPQFGAGRGDRLVEVADHPAVDRAEMIRRSEQAPMTP